VDTKSWAAMLGVPTEAELPEVPDCHDTYARSVRDIATRAVILQGVVAAAYGVDEKRIADWFRAEDIWRLLSPQESSLLTGLTILEPERRKLQWHQEAQWTLLWMLNLVDSLGLPTHCCNTAKLVDEIIPALGDDLQEFIVGASLRSPGSILAEDDRTYTLWCAACKSQRKQELLPHDLNLSVLFERRYAFEWLNGGKEWDDVNCDA
jgi:hypothetical protein